jgi:soluble lytic murein transglycosylase-like protein
MTLDDISRIGVRWLLVTPMLLSLGLLDAWADIYKYVDEHGHVHLSDRRLGPGYRRMVTDYAVGSATPWRYRAADKEQFAPIIVQTAERYRLEPSLIHAVIAAESGYDPNAVSKAGAVGLMQLMPATAARYGVKDRRDPAQNIQGGTHYLSDLLKRFNSLSLALAAYNAGEGAVIDHGHRIPPFHETRDYVRKVITYYRANL